MPGRLQSSLLPTSSYLNRREDDTMDVMYHESVVLHFRPDKQLLSRVMLSFTSRSSKNSSNQQCNVSDAEDTVTFLSTAADSSDARSVPGRTVIKVVT